MLCRAALFTLLIVGGWSLQGADLPQWNLKGMVWSAEANGLSIGLLELPTADSGRKLLIGIKNCGNEPLRLAGWASSLSIKGHIVKEKSGNTITAYNSVVEGFYSLRYGADGKFEERPASPPEVYVLPGQTALFAERILAEKFLPPRFERLTLTLMVMRNKDQVTEVPAGWIGKAEAEIDIRFEKPIPDKK